MSLIDRLFEGSVRVMDLDHEEYGEIALLLRNKIVVLDKERGTVRLNLSGSRRLMNEMLRELNDLGLVRNVGNGCTITVEGAMLSGRSDQVM